MGSLPVQSQSRPQRCLLDSGRSMVEIEEAPELPLAMDDRTFVAVGKESKTTVEYAAKNAGGKEIVLLHVHTPEQWIPMELGASFLLTTASTEKIREHRERERGKIDELLDPYKQICGRKGVLVDELVIEMDDIGKGILQAVVERGIANLVMGAAADRHLSSCKKTRQPRSKKAIKVGEQALTSCRISFVCKEELICTRELGPEGSAVWVVPPRPIAVSLSKSVIPSLRSPSLPESSPRFTNPVQDFLFRSKSDNYNRGGSNSRLTIPPPLPTPSTEEGRRRIVESPAMRACKMESHQAQHRQPAMDKNNRGNPVESLILSAAVTIPEEDAAATSHPNDLNDEGEESHYAQLEQAVAEAQKAGKVVIEAGRKARLELKAEIASLEGRITELGKQLVATEGRLHAVERERDEAIRLVEELCERKEDAANAANSSRGSPDFSEFRLSEVEEATNGFHESMKIGEGGFGSVYRGVLRQTLVAVKKLRPNGHQGQREFQQEVNVLSKVRHPKLVILIGTCPEAGALIYEYLPNGSLEDRLQCKNNDPPLPWQTRIKIVADICLALIFLHSSRPDSIVHGDLKPGNILLDSNWNAKLSDFGISRMIPQKDSASTLYWQTKCPRGTVPYLDPEYWTTAMLTPQSDVYSFGIVILQLLTRKQAMGIAKEVTDALERGYLQHVLDKSAGNWPLDEAMQLADIGVRCCDMSRRRRPDLAAEVWRVLRPMAAAVGYIGMLPFLPGNDARPTS